MSAAVAVAVTLTVMAGMFMFAGSLAIIAGMADARTVYRRAERVDDLPIWQCRECGCRWMEDDSPTHYAGCIVPDIERAIERQRGEI